MRIPFDTAEAVEVGGKAALMRLFLDSFSTECRDPLIPYDPSTDKIEVGMSLPVGRADVVIFHGDRSATVIKVKDGTMGYKQVAQGIGEVSLHAAGLALTGVKSIRRALLWSATGDDVQELMIIDACKLAGVLALPSPSMRERLEIARGILAAQSAADAFLARLTKGPA